MLEQVTANIVNEVGFAEGANGTASVVGQFVSNGMNVFLHQGIPKELTCTQGERPLDYLAIIKSPENKH